MSESNESAEIAGCPFTFDLRDPHDRAGVYGQYERLRAAGPVVEAVLTLGEAADAYDPSGTFGKPLLFATDYDAAVTALSDDQMGLDYSALLTPDQHAALPPLPDYYKPMMRNLLTMDPPEHTRLRRLVQPSFTPKVMEAMRPRIQHVLDELIDDAIAAAEAKGEAAPERRMELVDAIAYPLPMTVISELMGVPVADRPQVRAWSEVMVERVKDPERIAAAMTGFHDYLRQLFAAKRAQPGDDLTSSLVLAEDGGDRLDDDELLAMVLILIAAGHLTTVNLIGNGVLAVLNHPEQLERLRADPTLVKNAVEEVLRFWGPVEAAAGRFPRTEHEFEGINLTPGMRVMPGLAAANRDPARFANPEVFDIERADANRHIAFGRGVHLCLGAPLARVEGQVALETLFRRLPHLRLETPGQEPELHASLFRGPDELWVRF